MFHIISDSACDLSKEYVKEHDIDIVPLSVSFDDENYMRDSIDISRDECYERMVSESTVYPKTSLPSVESFYSVFEKYAKKGEAAVCFCISLVLSGSYNSAKIAGDMIAEDYPDSDITVLDSKQNTVTQALIVDQAVRMRDAGLMFKDAISKIKSLMSTARIIFTVGSLDYLKVGGRIGKLAGKVTGSLGINPIIIMKDGGIGVGGIGRSREKLKAKIIDLAKKYIEEEDKDNFVVSVGYGYDKEEGSSFMKEVESALSITLNKATNVAIGIVSAVHTGPHAIGIGIIRKFETLKEQ